MQNLDIFIDPLIGTIIGFGTNYIAVKMLFRPYKPIKIGKFTMPFTPGVIPKRREKLAEALGRTISSNLFTNEDIKDIFLSEDVKNVVVNSILKEFILKDETIKEILVKNIPEEKYLVLKQNIDSYIARKICEGLLSMNLGEVIAKEGANAIKEKIKGNFFGKFVSDDLINSIAIPAGEKVENYIKENGEEKILPYIDNELENFSEKTISYIIMSTSIKEDKIRNSIEKIYTKIVEEKMTNVFEAFNISEVITNKINNMDVRDIEKLFMDVMKKELKAIINLGAVLGFLLGVLNIFI